MYAAVYLSVLLWCSQTGAVRAELSKPQKLTMITMNTQYTLSWSRDPSHAAASHADPSHGVTFTAEYIAKYKLKRAYQSWTTVCEMTPHTHCDLTALKLHYQGIYVLRVRANAGGRHSEWVTKDFCPDKEASLGPPTKVDLAPAGSLLDVSIADPLTSANGSMRENMPMMYYRIVYWERSQDAQDRRTKMVESKANLVTLPDLSPWTSYCVTVQSRYDYYNKSSSFTTPHCMQTEGPTPVWQILLYFLASLLICFVGVLLPLYGSFRCYRTLKTTFFPSIQLPAHIQEYLFDSSPGSDMPRLLTSDSESELVCDKVSICSKTMVLEIHSPPPSQALPAPPSGLETDSSGRHSRQDSGGSGDSGVYSTEGGSGQSSVGTKTSSQASSRLDQLKMQDLGPEVKGHRLVVDEGVLDMSV